MPHAMVWDMQIDRGSTTLSVWTRSRGAYVYPCPAAAVRLQPPRVTECDRNSDGYADSNSNSDGYADCDSNNNGNSDTKTYTHTESCTDAEAASYAATPAIARN